MKVFNLVLVVLFLSCRNNIQNDADIKNLSQKEYVDSSQNKSVNFIRIEEASNGKGVQISFSYSVANGKHPHIDYVYPDNSFNRNNIYFVIRKMGYDNKIEESSHSHYNGFWSQFPSEGTKEDKLAYFDSTIDGVKNSGTQRELWLAHYFNQEKYLASMFDHINEASSVIIDEDFNGKMTYEQIKDDLRYDGSTATGKYVFPYKPNGGDYDVEFKETSGENLRTVKNSQNGYYNTGSIRTDGLNDGDYQVFITTDYEIFGQSDSYIAPYQGFAKRFKIEGGRLVKETINHPTNLAATRVSNLQFKLSWKDNSQNETGFKLYRSISNSAFSEVKFLSVNTVSYIDNVPSSNSEYTYKLKAVNLDAESSFSNIVKINNYFNAPSNLQVNKFTTFQIRINWSDNSIEETGFRLYRSINHGTFTLLNTLSQNTTSYLDNVPFSNTNYSYKIKAFNNESETNFSNIENIYNSSESQLNFICSSSVGEEIKLKWNIMNNATKYLIYRRVGGNHYQYRLIKTITNKNTIEHTDYAYFKVSKSSNSFVYLGYQIEVYSNNTRIDVASINFKGQENY